MAVRQAAGDCRPAASSSATEAFPPRADAAEAWLVGRDATRSEFGRGACLGRDAQTDGGTAQADAVPTEKAQPTDLTASQVATTVAAAESSSAAEPAASSSAAEFSSAALTPAGSGGTNASSGG